jgi:hypothetical protein
MSTSLTWLYNSCRARQGIVISSLHGFGFRTPPFPCSMLHAPCSMLLALLRHALLSRVGLAPQDFVVSLSWSLLLSYCVGQLQIIHCPTPSLFRPSICGRRISPLKVSLECSLWFHNELDSCHNDAVSGISV